MGNSKHKGKCFHFFSTWVVLMFVIGPVNCIHKAGVFHHQPKKTLNVLEYRISTLTATNRKKPKSTITSVKK